MGYFSDKVVWITGASSGLGAELAKQLSREGARLVLTGRNAAALEAVQQQCETPCKLLPADLEKDATPELASAPADPIESVLVEFDDAAEIEA